MDPFQQLSFESLRCPAAQVLELPEAAQLLATSATAPNEVWTVGDRLLAIQGHPEMAPQEALSKIHATLASNGCAAQLEFKFVTPPVVETYLVPA